MIELTTTPLLISLEKTGYFEINTSEDEFISVCSQLGTLVPSRKDSSFLDTLIPRLPEEAHPNSLSKAHGHRAFPFHTDGAYLRIPPKYIALRYSAGVENPTPTDILQITSFISLEDADKLKREIWTVRGRGLNFYSSILSETSGMKQPILRYDRGCMNYSGASSIFETLIEANLHKKISIDWSIGKTLFLNNWSIVHSRPEVKKNEINCRTLQRIMINE